MPVKEELFSFQGLVVTALHDVFALGVVGLLLLGVWVWTGSNPLAGATLTSEEQAMQFLLDHNPDSDIRFVPRKGGK